MKINTPNLQIVWNGSHTANVYNWLNNEIDVFTKRIQKILKDMDKTGKHMNTAGFSKVQYYIQFLTRQLEYVSDIQESLGLDESNKLVQKAFG